MKLIVGLGNPGTEYNFTRHNFGFLALDFFAKLENLTWQKPKFGTIWTRFDDKILIKPQDYYNLSGQATQEFIHFYKIALEDVLVICDDFDLPFGTTRYRLKGSSGGNNGLKSISASLATDDFPRLRLGTNNPEVRMRLGDHDFVLSRFTATEKAALPAILNSVAERIRTL